MCSYFNNNNNSNNNNNNKLISTVETAFPLTISI